MHEDLLCVSTTRAYSETVDVPERVPLGMVIGMKGQNFKLITSIAESRITGPITSAGKTVASCIHLNYLVINIEYS